MASILNATTTSGLVTSADNSGSLQLQTNNGTTAVTIDTSQNVGIGTTSPANKVHIQQTSAASSLTQLVLQNADNSTGTGSALGFANHTSSGLLTGKVEGAIDGANSYSMRFYTYQSGLNERMRITSGGEVYIAGTTDQGAYNLQCNGTGVWGAGAYTNGSDERIKDDIEPLQSGLDVVAKLNPVTYKYKEDWSKDQSTQTGFIAQELLVALEGQVYVDGVVQQGGSEGYYSVAYQNIIPILTKAIQEQQAMIEELKAEVQALKGVA